MSDEKQGVCLNSRLVKLVQDVRAQGKGLDCRVNEFDEDFAAFVQMKDDALLLLLSPDIGMFIASALFAAIGTGESFPRARDLASLLKLIPRQSTTGGKRRLLKVSKRGNKYLRNI